MRWNFSARWTGRSCGPYRFEKLLGEGRYGICYLACAEDGRQVVIKRFKPRMLKKNQEKNAYEAVLLSQLEHEAIPQLLGVINQPGLYAFVLEHKPGETLERMLFEHQHRFGQEEIYSIGRQLIQILKYLHEQGMVHRDIRIPNVLLHQGKVSLVDFGLARWADGQCYSFDQDFSYLGDLLLFLHYSTYEQRQRKSRPWYDELDLTGAQILLYKRMLRLEEPFASIQELEEAFMAAFDIHPQG